MSILGFDAIGRLAIGQVPKSSYIYLPVQPTSYSVSVKTVTTAVNLNPGTAAYVVTPNTVTFTSGSPVVSTASVNIAGQSSTYQLTYNPSSVGYLVTGMTVTFFRDFKAWFPRPFPSDSWTSESGPSTVWTPATVTTEVWTPE